MTRSSRILMLALTLLAPPLAAAQESPPFFPYTLQTERLENGLTVVRVPYGSKGLVAFYTVVRVGSRNEVEPGHTGFAHFFEHMMFRGTPENPQGQREKVLSGLGFNDNAFTTSDITVYHSFGPASGLETLIGLEADRFQNLEYSEQAFQTEAKAVLGEYHKSAANPARKLDEVLAATAFSAHTYRHTTLGFYEDIQKMPARYDYSREFFRRWYTPDNTTVFIVGDFDPEQALSWVRREYAGWSSKVAQAEIPPEPRQRQQKETELRWESPTLARLVYAWHTPGASLDTLDAQLQTVLAAYMTGPISRLHEQLVLKEQVAESVGSLYYERRDPHLFSLAATLKDARHLEGARRAFDRELKRIVGARVDPEKVEEIKSHLRYELLMGLETPNDVAMQLAWYAGIYGAPDALIRHYEGLAQVSAEQLIQFARRNMRARNRTIITLTPPKQRPATRGGKR